MTAPSLQVVGSATVENPSAGGVAAIDWPLGTQPGDFAVLILCTAVVVDGTIFEHDLTAEYFIPGQPAFVGWYHAFVPEGYDPVDNPIGLAWAGGPPGTSLHFLYEGANLVVYRNVKSLVGTDVHAPLAGSLSPYEYPGDDLVCNAAVLGVQSLTGTVIGAPGNDTLGTWTADNGLFRRLSSRTYHWDAGGLKGSIPPGSFPIPGTLPSFSSLVYALDLTGDVAVRQYPRDDTLGLGSAPRIYPPPKARRVVGGYQ